MIPTGPPVGGGGHPLLTPRLAIRTLRGTDGPAVARVYDEVVRDLQGWSGGIRPSLGAWLRGSVSQVDELAVCDRSTGQVVGILSLVRRGGSTRLGLSFGPDGRGRGFGREALAALVGWMRISGFPPPVIETSRTNVAMRRTAEAVGFVVVREYVHRLPNGTREPAVRYQLAPDRRDGEAGHGGRAAEWPMPLGDRS